MTRLIALLLTVMLTVMAVPMGNAMAASASAHRSSMPDCTSPMRDPTAPALPMNNECQKCCLAAVAMPESIGPQLASPPILHLAAVTRLVAIDAMPIPPPPQLA